MQSGWSLLHCACSSGMWDGIELLLKHGADPNLVCCKGRTPLHDTVSWFCRKRKALTIPSRKAIHTVNRKCAAIVKLLILAGCDFRIIDNVRKRDTMALLSKGLIIIDVLQNNMFAADIARPFDEDDVDLSKYFLHDDDTKCDDDATCAIDVPPEDNLILESLHPLTCEPSSEVVVNTLYLEVCIMISKAQVYYMPEHQNDAIMISQYSFC